jgi:hypothetical protein
MSVGADVGTWRLPLAQLTRGQFLSTLVRRPGHFAMTRFAPITAGGRSNSGDESLTLTTNGCYLVRLDEGVRIT